MGQDECGGLAQSTENGIFAHLDPSSLTSSGLERRTTLALYLFSRPKFWMHGRVVW
jgi:hypothetical protein